MTRTLSAIVAVVVAAAALPLLAVGLRGPRGARCAADGVELDGAPVVRVIEDGSPRTFCCVGCAATWLGFTGEAPSRVLVTDESSGREIDARNAWFVRSSVVAQPATGDRVHAFASEDDARAHADAYRGRVLTGPARPFAAAGDEGDGE